MSRTAKIERTTKESRVEVQVDLDGTGRSEVSTGVGFYDHMLDAFARHSLVDLVVTRTMSKAFALAGARLGYLAADPSICDAIRVVRLPYHLSAVTQATALAALRHAPELLGRVDDLRAERDATVAWLREQGLEVADSDANFALFGRFADRHVVWQGLVDRGVLIRETGPDGWLRVSIGTAEEMAAFKKALLETLHETTESTKEPE